MPTLKDMARNGGFIYNPETGENEATLNGRNLEKTVGTSSKLIDIDDVTSPGSQSNFEKGFVSPEINAPYL